MARMEYIKMSTNANIAILKEDGMYTFIYNHHDSYSSGVGAMLLRYYKTSEDVNSLIALGNLSSVGSKLMDDCDSYRQHLDLPIDERGTVSYVRDCKRWSDFVGEQEFLWEDEKPVETACLDEVMANEYVYVFVETEQCWYVSFNRDKTNPYQLFKLDEKFITESKY